MKHLWVSVLVLVPGAPVGSTDVKEDADSAFFRTRIAPVLKDACIKCHGGKSTRNNLDMTSRAELLRGGDHGPAIVPGDPERSLLVRSIRYQGDFQMPPSAPLDERKVADLVEWIKRGAPWPARK